MIRFPLSVEALGRTAFGYSPLSEVVCSLRVLADPQPGHLMQPWIAEARGRLAGLDTALLKSVAPPGRWLADFMFAWSPDPGISIERQLDVLADVPAEVLRADAELCWRGRQMPELLDGVLDSRRPGQPIAEAIWAYWEVAIQPYWPRIRAVLDDDLSLRGRAAMAEGVLTVFDDLHPEVTHVGSTIFIDKPHHADVTFQRDQIALVPSVFVWPHLVIGHRPGDPFHLTYAARGIGRVWERLEEDVPENDLGALLGRNRAAILRRLGIPMSTTQLARGLGQSPGTIHQHLSVLKRNGLLESWRSGRNVLYRRTELAASIVASADHLGTAQVRLGECDRGA